MPALWGKRNTTPQVWVACFALALFSCSALGASAVRSLQEMRHNGVVIQEWDLSCGAAALATILNYQHSDRVSEKEIAIGMMGREEYLNDPKLVNARQGFSLLDLKRFVDARGYQGEGYGQLGLDDLMELAPIVVPVNFLGYNHFVIFRGRKNNRVLLADPAWGNRTVLQSRFERAWVDYPELGHVGFVVNRADGTKPTAHWLVPRDGDFVFVR